MRTVSEADKQISRQRAGLDEPRQPHDGLPRDPRATGSSGSSWAALRHRAAQRRAPQPRDRAGRPGARLHLVVGVRDRGDPHADDAVHRARRVRAGACRSCSSSSACCSSSRRRYLDVIKYYTTAGGSYVVARDNFGPKIAQIAAVALLIDYIVTVAVQCSAGTAALTTAVPGAYAPGTVADHASASCSSSSTATCADCARPAATSRFPTYFYVADARLDDHRRVRQGVLAGTLHHIAQPATHLLVDGHLGHPGHRVSAWDSRSSRCCAPTPTAGRR